MPATTPATIGETHVTFITMVLGAENDPAERDLYSRDLPGASLEMASARVFTEVSR